MLFIPRGMVYVNASVMNLNLVCLLRTRNELGTTASADGGVLTATSRAGAPLEKSCGNHLIPAMAAAAARAASSPPIKAA
jgi:hypothetical protein